MHATAPNSPYAMGWLADAIGDVPILWHTGAVANYHCDMLLIPDLKLGVAILSNVNNILMEHQFSLTIKDVGALLAGYAPPARHAARYRLVYWLITFAAAVWIVWRARQAATLWQLRRSQNPHGASALSPVVWLLDPGLSIGLVFGVRLVLHTPFSTLRWFVPDLMSWLIVNVFVSLALAAAAIRLQLAPLTE
jgi:hypothetical protein